MPLLGIYSKIMTKASAAPAEKLQLILHGCLKKPSLAIKCAYMVLCKVRVVQVILHWGGFISVIWLYDQMNLMMAVHHSLLTQTTHDISLL